MKSPHFQDILSERLTRRGLLEGGAAVGLLSLAGPALSAKSAAPDFKPVTANTYDTVTVPEGYESRVLISWGDPLYESVTAPFDRATSDRADQELRFGFNNDMLALFPAQWTFPAASDPKGDYILCVNNEYFDQALMYGERALTFEGLRDSCEAAFTSMGVSIVRLKSANGEWRVLKDAAPGPQAVNRRITPFTPVIFSGPAQSHPWIKEAGDKANAIQNVSPPSGAYAVGTMSNCAGGWTPWGTYLTVEENFDNYLPTSQRVSTPSPKLEQDAGVFDYSLVDTFRRPGLPAHLDRASNPYAAALYGWAVEIDPYDPSWTPRKRTALGRRKGECATSALTKDGRVAIYAGDDERGQFVYKFVSAKKFNPKDRIANRDLLDAGSLYAAQFQADGKGKWLKLELAAVNAALKAQGVEDELLMADEGDLMVRARVAAAALGATPMDRPEDVECPVDARYDSKGVVLVVCTNNSDARAASPGNPRRGTDIEPNVTGHILRLDETGQDAGATSFKWDVFAMAGDPESQSALSHGSPRAPASAWLGKAPSFRGDRFACPDNIAFDGMGRVFIATDGSTSVFRDCNDSVLVTSLSAKSPRLIQRFLTGPVGSEICGPLLTLDARTFFCAIQHPGQESVNGRHFGSALFMSEARHPASSWPDGGKAWPRPGVIYVRRKDGGRIGGN